jgi:hypothetical protein
VRCTAVGRRRRRLHLARQTAWVTRRYAAALAAEIALETFVPLETTEFTPTLRAIEARGCDLVLMADGLEFNVLAQMAPP